MTEPLLAVRQAAGKDNRREEELFHQ